METTVAAKRKATRSNAPNPRRKGLEKAMVRLEPRQLEALRKVAVHRMLERGAGRIDASEVVREAIDEWLKKHRT